MATKTVTDQSFSTDVLGADGPVLVDFWAEWCGPCRMIAPALEEIANDLGDKLTIAKLNIDENPDTPGRYGVRGIPTMLLFKGGQPVAQKVGAAPRSQIQQWVESNLDASVAVERRLGFRAAGQRAVVRGLGSAKPYCIRAEALVPRQIVAWIEPCDLAPPEDVIFRGHRVRIVERDGAEVDGFRLVFDRHEQRRPALAAEGSLPEAARADAPDRIVAPEVATQSPRLMQANACAGAPLLNWQVRQWHQPQSNGSLLSSKRTAPHMHPPVIPIHAPLID